MRRPPRQLIVIAAIVSLALAAVLVTGAIIAVSLDSSRDDVGRSTYFIVESDESVDSIADRLNDEGLIRSPGYFRFRIRLQSKGDDIVAGRYRLDTAMSTSQIINAITSEDAAIAQEAAIQFIEGWRTEQYAEAAVAAGLSFTVDEFMLATRDPKWNNEFAFLHTRPSGVALEGYLFPDTYNFRMDATPDDVIERLLATFEERVTSDLIAQADRQGMTLHQIMTVASIVEREAAVATERGTISSVYHNRLEAGMPLQADPTIQYQLGLAGNWWPELTAADVQRNGVYNTYLNPSLPPGPICNPSLAAIEAALNPEQTPYIFFVATGDGTHAFAETFEEHQRNIDQYQRGQ
ncbi:MAG: endolytic transglycosylase MltG [Thermomicrobiales bacterium]